MKDIIKITSDQFVYDITQTTQLKAATKTNIEPLSM